MIGSTAQLAALCCHFNSRVRGIAVEPFFPVNSTCRFCEYVHFLRQEIEGSSSSNLVANTPDDWLAHEAIPGRSAVLEHYRVDGPYISDRNSAGFVGGGGQWFLAVAANGRKDVWQASWEVGDQKAAEQRIWRVRYGLIAEQDDHALPKLRSVDLLCDELRRTLAAIAAFAEVHRLEGFAACFNRASRCLSLDDPFAEGAVRDLSPKGLLSLAAQQLLAACQAAWVFGGMGSWNDLAFEGAEQARYEQLSDGLFNLLNEGICISVNSTAADVT